jgi:undecaprenyl-diphosphatase
MIVLQSGVEWSLLDKLLHADYWLMLKINKDWSNPLFDRVSIIARESLAHIPVYVFLFLFITMNFGRKGVWWAVAILAMAGISDFISSQFIKEWFNRPRPCRDPLMAHQIRFLARFCGMNGSFISSHASNHFAVAMFIYQTLGAGSRWWSLFFIWAAIVALSQVYVGVHYPSDMLGGALFGCLLGFFWARLFNRQVGLAKA